MAKQPQKTPASECWYDTNGKRGDAAIHEPILEGEHFDAHNVGVAVATRIGLSPAERDALYGGVEQDRLADEAGRRAHRANVYAKHRAANQKARAADAFDPDEDRDQQGRWTSGGGSGSTEGVSQTFKRGDRVAVKASAQGQYAAAKPPLNVGGKVGTVSSTLIGNEGRRHFVKFDQPINAKGGTGAQFPAEHLEAAATKAKPLNEVEQMKAVLAGKATPTPRPSAFGGRRTGPGLDNPAKPKSALERAEEAFKRAFSPPDKVVGLSIPPGKEYVGAYHGTTEEVLPSIRKNGLVPKASAGADKWAEAHDMPTAQLMESGDRKHSVYICSAPAVAAEFARIAAEERHQTPTVLEVHIPVAEARKNLVPDERARSNRGVAFARYKGTIKPEWVTREVPMENLAHQGNMILRTEAGRIAGVAKDAAATKTKAVYLVVFDPLPDEQAA